MHLWPKDASGVVWALFHLCGPALAAVGLCGLLWINCTFKKNVPIGYGPNDARCIVWAIGIPIYLFFRNFYILNNGFCVFRFYLCSKKHVGARMGGNDENRPKQHVLHHLGLLLWSPASLFPKQCMVCILELKWYVWLSDWGNNPHKFFIDAPEKLLPSSCPQVYFSHAPEYICAPNNFKHAHKYYTSAQIFLGTSHKLS